MAETTRNASVSVATTGTVISSPKPGRIRTDIMIRNLDGANYITVSITEQGSLTTDGSGIILRPYDTIYFSGGAGYLCPQGAINAIANTGACTCAVYERYI